SLIAAGMLALAVPALADDNSSATPSAQQQCSTEKAQMGASAFAQTYGTNKNRSNAFGKCVSKRSAATDTASQQAHANASQECTAEENADPAAFKAKYGSGKNGAN